MRAGRQQAAPLSSSGGALRRGCSRRHACQGLLCGGWQAAACPLSCCCMSSSYGQLATVSAPRRHGHAMHRRLPAAGAPPCMKAGADGRGVRRGWLWCRPPSMHKCHGCGHLQGWGLHCRSISLFLASPLPT